GPAVTRLNGPVTPVNVRDQFFQDVTLVLVVHACGAIDIPAIAAFWHDDDYAILRGIIGHVGAVHPVAVMPAQTVQQIHDGITRYRGPLIIPRQNHVVR